MKYLVLYLMASSSSNKEPIFTFDRGIGGFNRGDPDKIRLASRQLDRDLFYRMFFSSIIAFVVYMFSKEHMKLSELTKGQTILLILAGIFLPYTFLCGPGLLNCFL